MLTDELTPEEEGLIGEIRRLEEENRELKEVLAAMREERDCMVKIADIALDEGEARKS